MTHIMVRPIWALIVVGACMLGVGVAGIVYTKQVQQSADHRWCALLDLAAGAPTARPPGITDEEWARRLAGARELARLHDSLGC